MNGIRVEQIDSADQLAAHQNAWRALWSAIANANPFYHPGMLLPAWQHLGDGNVKVFLVYQQDTLLALVPLQLRSRFRAVPASWLRAWGYIHCFNDEPLLHPRHQQAATAALLAHWKTQGHQLASWLKLPIDTALQWPPRDLADDCLPSRRACLQPLAPDYQPLDQALSKKKLKEYRRQWRRLAEQGELLFEHFDNANALPKLDDFLRLEASGWKGNNDSALASHQADERFLRTFCGNLADAEMLQIYQLTVGGTPVAMLLVLASDAHLYLFKICFDESLARFSPGVLLMLEATRHWEQGAYTMIDSCAQQDHPMIDKLWSQKRVIQRHHLSLGGWYGSLLLTFSRWITTWQLRKEHNDEQVD